ncbi:MAG: DUF3810 family protein [Acidobacteriota bacterium]
MTPSGSRRPVRGWVAALVVAAASALAPLPPRVVEFAYARGVFPYLQRTVTAVSNLVPIAVLDILILAAIVGVSLRVTQLVGLARVGAFGVALWEGVRRLIRLAAVVLIAFIWMWGLNYRRPPLESSLSGGAVTPTVADLRRAIADANTLAARVRPASMAGPVITYEESAAQLAIPMRTALAAMGRAPLGRDGRPKHSILLTPFFRWAGVNGMINPLALESIVQSELLPFERPFVLAHEWAHLAGQADEAEANAVGWLACMNGGPALTYSASLYLISEAYGALPPGARRQAFSQLDAGVRADLSEISRRATRQEKPKVQAAASRVYDNYLRANRVEDGNASYSRALTLILAPTLRAALAGQLAAP